MMYIIQNSCSVMNYRDVFNILDEDEIEQIINPNNFSASTSSYKPIDPKHLVKRNQINQMIRTSPGFVRKLRKELAKRKRERLQQEELELRGDRNERNSWRERFNKRR